MFNTCIRKIAVFIILVTMLITVAAEITNVLAQLNEEQIMNLINDRLEERDKHYTWFGWSLGVLSLVTTIAGTIFGIRFKQHLDLAKELQQIRTDISTLQRQYRDLSNQFNTLQAFFIAFAILYGVAIGILAVLILR